MSKRLDVSNPTLRERASARLLPAMLALSDDLDPAALLVLAVFAGEHALPIHDALNRLLHVEHDPGALEWSWRCVPHDALAHVFGELDFGTPAQREALGHLAVLDVGRVVWILEDGGVELVEVPLDDDARAAWIRFRRERIFRERLVAAGIPPGAIVDKRTFVPGSARDPNTYLPEPLPAGWVRETGPRAIAPRVLIGGELHAVIEVSAMRAATLVRLKVGCARRGGLPTDADVQKIIGRIRNVIEFRELPRNEATRFTYEVMVLPDWRLFIAASALTG
jgi:hypothetical protein